jgi:DNA-binding NtrC family response regulator
MARLLIVDDDEEFRESFAFTLKRMRYEIVESDNALDAQHKFTQYTFDMVITDMRMPKKPGGFEDENAGLDLLRDIKKKLS